MFLFSNLTDISILSISFFLALISSFITIPPVVALAKGKKLLDIPNGRTVHKFATPTLGGIAIFAGFFFSSLIFSCSISNVYISRILAGCLLIFLVGMKDDIFVLSPTKKFITQFLAALIVVFLADLRITSFHGVFGVNELHYIISVLVSVFVIVAITNAINLIDGIDGLAASVSFVAAMSFGSWFFIAEIQSLALICFALAGALLGFLPYNFSKSEKRKIFMGDTGSLLTGFILGCVAIGFNEANLVVDSSLKIGSAPAVSIGFLFLPIFDTLRVMIIRIIKGKSPFSADKRHVHHLLLKLGYSHWQATVFLSLVTAMFITISLLLQNIGVLWLILVQTLLALVLYFVPFTVLIKKANNNLKKTLKEYNVL